jgi:hypothetical protein
MKARSRHILAVAPYYKCHNKYVGSSGGSIHRTPLSGSTSRTLKCDGLGDKDITCTTCCPMLPNYPTRSDFGPIHVIPLRVPLVYIVSSHRDKTTQGSSFVRLLDTILSSLLSPQHEAYVETWLQGPSPTGTIILGFNDVDRDFGPRLTPGTLTENPCTITVDIMPLVKLRRQNPNFQFYFVCKDNTTTVIPKAEEQNIDDNINRIEASTRK